MHFAQLLSISLKKCHSGVLMPGMKFEVTYKYQVVGSILQIKSMKCVHNDKCLLFCTCQVKLHFILR